MAESRKNGRLTKRDLQLIGLILVKLGARLNRLVKQYEDSEKYSKKVLSQLKTNKGSALISLLFMDFEPEKCYTPSELKQMITNNLTHGIDPDSVSMLPDYERKIAQGLPSNRLSEILKSLTDGKLFSHINDKERPILKGHSEIKTPGPYSEYKLSSQAQKIKKFLDKPEVIDIIIDSLMQSDLIPKLLTSICKCFLYMVRDGDEELLCRRISMFSPDKTKELPLIKNGVNLIKQGLIPLNNEELEGKAETLATSLHSGMTNYYNRLFLIYGVSEL